MSGLRIVIFAKAPLPGFAKTRLVPALGEDGAARLAERMLRHTVTEALAAEVGEVELCVTPEQNSQEWQSLRDPAWTVDWQAQGDGDLGARLARATERSLAERGAVLLIGTDCPGLTRDHLRVAAARLQSHNAVIIPSADGGYVLLGLTQYRPRVFQEISWSTDTVAFETLCQIGALGWTVAQLPMLRDIDEPADLVALPPGWLAP